MLRTVRCVYQDRPSGDASEWLRVIRKANTLAKVSGEESVFGEPTHLGPWWAGGFVEEYDEARVLLPIEGSEDQSVRIVPKSERADRLIHEAFVIVRNEG